MEKVFLIIIATINPSEKEALSHYLGQMNLLYELAGAQPVARYNILESLTGNDFPNLVVVMEFPSREAVLKVFESDTYNELLPYRETAFSDVRIHISGS